MLPISQLTDILSTVVKAGQHENGAGKEDNVALRDEYSGVCYMEISVRVVVQSDVSITSTPITVKIGFY